VFGPLRWVTAAGLLCTVGEKDFMQQRACSRSCSKRQINPMSKHQSRLKMKATLKRIRHRPIQRGGNGQLLPLPQLALLHALGEGWEAEHLVKTGKLSGYPTSYKLDLANVAQMICVEVDGSSHTASARKQQDMKKVALLTSLGWSVYRVSNERALSLYSTFTSVDTLLTSLMGS
jgi:hypothetical protein